MTLLGFGDVFVNASSCGKECITTFRKFSNASTSDEYALSLYTINPLGSSEIIEFPTAIRELLV